MTTKSYSDGKDGANLELKEFAYTVEPCNAAHYH